jgi:regulator of CtrA degradation
MKDVSNHDPAGGSRITPRLVESLYTEAMLLADEARTYFDLGSRADRDLLEPFVRVGFACESLKVTTRLMHIIAWLLTQRAVENGELDASSGRRPERRLGHAGASDLHVVEQLPDGARALISSSIDLYERVRRLDEEQLSGQPVPSPARALMGRLERDLIWNSSR